MTDYVNGLVSIIMPTYNCGKYIIDSIQSVIAQTYTNWELIIVDDCSTDNTKEILRPVLSEHKNIQYICLDKNSGAAVARTKAIDIAKGEYVAFLDSDDLWDQDKLKKQLEWMKNNSAKFSCTAYRLMDENGKLIGTSIYPPDVIDYNKCIRLSNPIGNLTAMYNQKELGKYAVPDIKKRNDFALWLQILKDIKCYGMNECLASYRSGRFNSVSSNKLSQAKYHWQLYRKIEKHSIIRSIYEVCCWAFVKGTKVGLDRRNDYSQ